MPTSSIDWDYIRMKWEAGQTAYAISQDLGGKPTKQGISKHARKKGWERRDNALTVAESLPIVQRAQALTGPTKCTAECIAFVLELVGKGATPKMACNAAGISPETLRRWRNEDPQLEERIRQARAGKLAEWVSRIDAASEKDWKAAKDLLQAAPDADDFNQQQSGGITVVLNIDREAIKPVIDS